MKVDKIKIGAVIPVQKYGNLQPEIEISSDDAGEDILGVGMEVIKSLFTKYSEVGGIQENNFVPSVAVVKTSFNESGVVVEFEPITHTYTYNGNKLTGVTDYLKKFYKPFDLETVSSVLESKWGVPQKIIKAIWEANGDLTSGFGSSVHKALEDYEKFKDFGEIISSKKGEEENYCLPKHPKLREIVKGFVAINKLEKFPVFTEVLISDVATGICGQADRIVVLDQEKKICRVQDYKVNVNSEEIDKSNKVLPPFGDLPANKISKYQLQMSIYANMLQKSGWTVVGLDVYVYESEWKHFELEVLKVIN